MSLSWLSPLGLAALTLTGAIGLAGGMTYSMAPTGPQIDIVDTTAKSNPTPDSAVRQIILAKRYLNLPIKSGGPQRLMSVEIEGQPPLRFQISLADGRPDWWAYMEIGLFKGKTAVIKVENLPADSNGLTAIDQSDRIKGWQSLYREALRPQFHFTARRGWVNDPNGLVFYKGEYHLFFQHNPYGWSWGSMHWGQAVSRDLVHWKELPIALFPDEHGAMWSGSAVVDWDNTTGLQSGEEKTLVCMYTTSGTFTQDIATSNDRGRTWTKYAGNPVIGNIVGENRDPKVIWYAPERKWVMALFLDNSDFALFSSKDLKHWERMSDVTVPGTGECPNFFPLPLDGDRKNTRWIFYGGNGRYLVGNFDGTTFHPESGPHPMEEGNCWYASQVFSDIPVKDSRCILVPWGQIDLPGMPFNQMIGLPVELTLHTTKDGPRIFAKPVRELESLRIGSQRISPGDLRPGDNPLGGCHGELLEVVAAIKPGDAKEIEFDLRGVKVSYDVSKQELSCLDKNAELGLGDGAIHLRMFVDRTSIDIFGNDGRLYMPMGAILDPHDTSISLRAVGGTGTIQSLNVYPLKSIWSK